MNKNNDYKIKLSDLIESSAISDEDKRLWYAAISFLSEESLENILSMLTEDPSSLDFLTKNLKEKKAALESKKPEEWEKVVASEEEFLEK